MIEIQNAFLGSIIKQPDNMDKLGKVYRSWFDGGNRYVYDALLMLYTNNKGIDVVTVTDQLKGILGDKYKDNFLKNVLDAEFNPSNFETYQNRLEEECLRRSMVIQLNESILAVEKASPGNVKSIVDTAEGKIFQISQDMISTDTLQRMGDVGVEVMKEIRSYKEDGVPSFMANTGLTDIDAMIGGFKAGQFIILAAAPSMGKTALLLQILRNNIASGVSVGMISLEMNKGSMFYRHLSAESDIDSLRIMAGNITSNEFDRCVAAWKRINEMSFCIDDNSGSNEVILRGAARRMVKLYNIKLLGVDYLQLMDCSDRVENRQQEISKISRSLKNLSKELAIPIIVLSQLSREVSSRNPPIPRLSDLRESGALEQDADDVIFIYRPEYYDLPSFRDGTPSTGFAEIIIGKARNGRTGSQKTVFMKDRGTFENAYLGEDKSEEVNN
jgi:replicative DNA helicase